MIVKHIIETIIKQHLKNGGPYWSREDGDIHAPHGSSTIDTIHVLGELGATVNEYPFFRYNIFYYVYVLSFYKYAIKDKRFKDAFHILKGKNEHDKIRLENPHRAWRKFDFARKATDNLLANQRWTEIQSNCQN